MTKLTGYSQAHLDAFLTSVSQGGNSEPNWRDKNNGQRQFKILDGEFRGVQANFFSTTGTVMFQGKNGDKARTAFIEYKFNKNTSIYKRSSTFIAAISTPRPPKNTTQTKPKEDSQMVIAGVTQSQADQILTALDPETKFEQKEQWKRVANLKNVFTEELGYITAVVNFYSSKKKGTKLHVQGRDSRIVRIHFENEIETLREEKRKKEGHSSNNTHTEPSSILCTISDVTPKKLCEHCGLQKQKNVFPCDDGVRRHHCRFEVRLQCSKNDCNRIWSTVGCLWESTSGKWDAQYCRECYDEVDENSTPGKFLDSRKLDPNRKGTGRRHESDWCARCLKGDGSCPMGRFRS